MIICRSIANAARKGLLAKTGSIVTIGNFDGVHLGHQAMLSAAKARADELDIPLVVLSFDPHPAAYFSHGPTPARLSSFGERILALKGAGVDIACILPFDGKLAALDHNEFSQEILSNHLSAKTVMIGDDFQYGKGRAGNVNTLRASGRMLGFEVRQLGSVIYNEQRVSSTKIRNLLGAGKMQIAAQFLGGQYTIVGRVARGDQRGRVWGFPTLNLPMRVPRALQGVFAVRVRGLGNKPLQGVANLGNRPTVDGLKYLLEAHLFDYNSDAYGKRICVEFYEQIRKEQKFESFEDLKMQITRDIQVAKNFFSQ